MIIVIDEQCNVIKQVHALVSLFFCFLTFVFDFLFFWGVCVDFFASHLTTKQRIREINEPRNIHSRSNTYSKFVLKTINGTMRNSHCN